MTTVPQSLRNHIAENAKHCCEYCQTAQEISGAQMHVEHIMPLSRDGDSRFENLCLACAWCNSFKGTQIEGVDTESGESVSLFNPRQQTWSDHFYWDDEGITIVGKTDVGRVTINVLKMNNSYILPARRHWVEAGWHPPQ